MFYRLIRLILPLALLFLEVLSAAPASAGTVSDIIRRTVAEIRIHKNVKVAGAGIASHSVLPVLYEKRDYHPVWTDPAAVDQLLDAVAQSEEDGLRPIDYHFNQLKTLQSESERPEGLSPERSAAFDLLLTDSLVRLGYHLMFGKEDPVTFHPHWNLDQKIDDVDPAEMLQAVIESCSVRPLMDDCISRHPAYSQMKSVLARYRQIEASGGWELVPPGPTLENGMTDARVPALRRRLAATGDLAVEATLSTEFDDPLEQAVIRFQIRHFLHPDGRVGKHTLQALNVSVEQRIGTIRVALERLRWVIRGVPKTYVVADIARFEAAYYKNNRQLWKSRTQVGRPYRETPVFRSDITYLVFNPTWTVPPSILRKDILPAVRKDGGYLKARNIRVIDNSGNEIDMDAIDWDHVTGNNFPYQLRQDPGPSNALGRVKFIFPNPNHVYMHDTPSRALFEKEDRAFSSGCIRIEKPLDLAQLLLDDPVTWTREKIEETIDSGQTRTVWLKKPVPVLLLYATAWVDEDGTVYFARDIYDRDPAVLEGLDSAFSMDQPPNGNRPAL